MAKRAKAVFTKCGVERRMVLRGYVGLGGAMTSSRTVVETCGVPLFEDGDQATGVCPACRRGWTHPESQPTAKGLAQIARGAA